MPALAAETDWLYFPMYERDTAHAVHLSALRFRADGLLDSATRYPRVPDAESWTEEQSQRGWYVYQPRLIDCETGFHVETRMDLLDRDGATIATQPYEPDKLATRIVEQLRRHDNHRWPSSSEIFLACAAASSNTLKARRVRAARSAQPLVSYQPITQALKADSEALFALTKFHYDFTAFDVKAGKRLPATPVVLFEQLQAQYVAWRRSIYRWYAPPRESGASVAHHAQTKALANRLLDRAGGRPGTLRVLGGGVIEYEADWLHARHVDLPKMTRAMQEKLWTRSSTTRVNCTSHLSVPLAYNWLDAKGAVLMRTPLQTKEALALIKGRYEDSDDVTPDFWSGASHGSEAAQLCALVESAARGESSGHADRRRDAQQDEDLPFGLTAETIAAQKTPAEMLLVVRAAWRRARQVQDMAPQVNPLK